MPGVNPVVLIQLMMSYHRRSEKWPNKDARVFAFQKNNRMRVHKETEDEVNRRKSRLDILTCQAAEAATRMQLAKTLKGRVGKVWIDPALSRIAVPLETATGNSGFGILPTGSRIKIPKGKFVRAFTYWEKVNDIDLSVFALDEKGRQEEFSWRNMYGKQSDEIVFSGDQTSGYSGGSEYYDISLDEFKLSHPKYRYLVFCNNVYSGIDFSKCDCRAGFMIREENPMLVPSWKGERECTTNRQALIFDPRTVTTSYRIDAKGTYACLFAIDLEEREMVWLNIVRSDRIAIAGTSGMDWLLKYLRMADVFNITDLYGMAGELLPEKNLNDADIVVTDNSVVALAAHNAEVVHSWDFEKFLELLRA